MTTHRIGTREEQRAARLELLKAEKELTRQSDELTRRRQELPWVRIDKEYRFDTDEGQASLGDLFEARRSRSWSPISGRMASTTRSPSTRRRSSTAATVSAPARRRAWSRSTTAMTGTIPWASW